MKKTFAKAGQWTAEKTGQAKKTQLDDSFVEVENQAINIEDMVQNIGDKTAEYLQPNPTTRIKVKTVGSKPYPQHETELGNTMCKFGSKLSSSGLIFGQALTVAGEAERAIGEARTGMDSEISSNFIKPLSDYEKTEVKESAVARKKLESRRLTYDAAKRASENKPHDSKLEQNYRQEEAKFEEIKEQAYNTMLKLIDNDAEMCAQLLCFFESQLAFHETAANILKPTINELRQIASTAPTQHEKPIYQGRNSTQPSTSSNRQPAYGGNTVNRTPSGGNFGQPAPPTYNDGGYGGEYGAAAPTQGLQGGYGGQGGPPPAASSGYGYGYGQVAPPARSNSAYNSGTVGGAVGGIPPGRSNSTGNTYNISNSSLGAGGGAGMGSGPSPGQRGRAMPPPPPASRQKFVIVNYDFVARDASELDLRRGDRVQVLKEIDKDWMEGTIHGKKGIFPINYVTYE